jgi:hypothetical protein
MARETLSEYLAVQNKYLDEHEAPLLTELSKVHKVAEPRQPLSFGAMVAATFLGNLAFALLCGVLYVMMHP